CTASGQLACQDIAQDLGDLVRVFCNRKRGSINFLQGMLMFRPVKNDQRLSECGCHTGIEGGIPLPVFFTEAHNNDISLGNAAPRPDRVDAGSLVVMPELLLLGSEDGDAAVIAGLMIRNRTIETDIQVAGSLDDLVTPVSVNFPGQVDF